MCRPVTPTLPLAVASYRIGRTYVLEMLEEAPVALAVGVEWLRWRVFCLERARRMLRLKVERSRDGASNDQERVLVHTRQLVAR